MPSAVSKKDQKKLKHTILKEIKNEYYNVKASKIRIEMNHKKMIQSKWLLKSGPWLTELDSIGCISCMWAELKGYWPSSGKEGSDKIYLLRKNL